MRERIAMKNVTIAFDDELLARGREYARRQNLSFNAFVRDLVDQRARLQSEWVEDFFRLADELNANSEGQVWTRDELYRS